MSLIPLNWKCRSKRWKRSSLRHDGPVGETLAHKRHILVEDRAYFKIERIDPFAENGQDFVIRIKENGTASMSQFETFRKQPSS